MKTSNSATVESIKANRGLNRGGGKTRTVFQITLTDADGDLYQVLMSRKWGAEDFASWIREGNWDGTGCAEMDYENSDDPRASRWNEVRCPYFGNC